MVISIASVGNNLKPVILFSLSKFQNIQGDVHHLIYDSKICI